jgi:hypothetical protein
LGQDAVEEYHMAMQKLDDNNGFQTIKFGQNARDLLQENKISFSADNESGVPLDSTYFSEDKALSIFNIGDIRVKALRLSSYKDSLYQIVVVIESEDKQKLLQALEAGYGDGYQRNQFIDNYTWMAKKVTLTYNMEKQPVYLMYEYKPIVYKKDDAEREVNRRRAGKL